MMSTEQSKAIDRRLIEEVWNQGHLTLIDELCDPGCVLHDATSLIEGTEGMKQYILRDRTAFPDIHFTIEDQIAGGNEVATRFTCRGTHQGPLAGMAPTGKQITVSGIVLTRFVNGRLVEGWMHFDTLGMLQQLGAVPVFGR